MKSFLIQHPLILGGLIPMFLFGLMTFPVKILNGKLHFGYYIFLTGLGVMLVGAVMLFYFSSSTKVTGSQVLLGLLNGFLWGLGALCIFIALLNPKATVSQLAPLYNINTLISVLIGVIFFAEWQNIVVWKTILGTILIILGGWLVV